MKRRYGIDTSVLVRLLTGEPEKDYLKTIDALENLIAGDASSRVVASNQVIGEAYIAVQHHYGVPKQAARSALLEVFASGLVSPLNGASVLKAIATRTGCGLLDRLIVDDYQREGVVTVTNDRKMAALEEVRRLSC